MRPAPVLTQVGSNAFQPKEMAGKYPAETLQNRVWLDE